MNRDMVLLAIQGLEDSCNHLGKMIVRYTMKSDKSATEVESLIAAYGHASFAIGLLSSEVALTKADWDNLIDDLIEKQ